jgi:poly(hydroxyalkanoate) granule-associated protein
MVTKLKKEKPAQATGANIGGSVKDSAQQIWQAGLGAFAKAQAEGTRAFEALVKEGTTLQRKTQAAAEEKISDATNRMSNMATDISSKASGHWDKLENIFEERVAKALNKLGVPSAKDINALIARIDDLNLSVQKLSGTAPVATKATTPKKAAPRKASTGKAAGAKAAAKRVPAKTVVPEAAVAQAAAEAAAAPAEVPAAQPAAKAPARKPATKRVAARKTA